MAESTAEGAAERNSAIVLQVAEREEQAQAELPSSSNSDASFTNDELFQIVEDGIRDLCTLRTKIPQKVAELVAERYEVRQKAWAQVSTADYESAISQKQLDLQGLNSICSKMTEGLKTDSLREDLVAIQNQYKSLIQLSKIKSQMGLNDTTELLFSEKRKRKRRASLEEAEHSNQRILRPGRESSTKAPSVVPEIKKTPVKRTQSASKIPKRKQGMTPTTPMSTRSSTKKRTCRLKLLAKT